MCVYQHFAVHAKLVLSSYQSGLVARFSADSFLFLGDTCLLLFSGLDVDNCLSVSRGTRNCEKMIIVVYSNDTLLVVIHL